jgi:uncharacterized membrane protein YdfJ with MMPL/SSD domain
MRTAGRTVVFSAVTVAVSLAALAWFPLPALRSIALAGVATALLAAAASLTLLPALFAVLGPRIELGRLCRRPGWCGAGRGRRLAPPGRACHAPSLPIATVVTVVLLLALVLSGLSLNAAFGALVWLLGDFPVTGAIISTVLVMLFAVAFGLAMDYRVFMPSRIREEYERCGDGRAAVAMGLERMGRIVTAAAVLASIVFLAFLVSDITVMKAFGVGLPLAVLLDATLIRGALLPAAMRWGGRATWWAPGPLRWLHASLGLREPAEHTPTPRVGVRSG